MWKYIQIPFFSGKDSMFPLFHVSGYTLKTAQETTHSYSLSKSSDNAAMFLFIRLALSGQKSVPFSFFEYNSSDTGTTDYI